MPVQIDMEMPRSCLDCRFCIEEPYGGANCIASGIWGREICEHIESIPCVIRKKWCPLTETTDTKWHAVAEGDLPEETGRYLLQMEVTNPEIMPFMIGFYRSKSRTFPLENHYHHILAWRELPEPWKGAMK